MKDEYKEKHKQKEKMEASYQQGTHYTDKWEGKGQEKYAWIGTTMDRV